MLKIEQRYLVNSVPAKVWDALTNPKTIEKWGAGPANMSPDAGADFSLWGGDVYGKNLESVKDKKLVQEWYGGDWELPSTVTIELNYDGKNTEIILVQENAPQKEIDDLSEGWRDYYFLPIKKFIEKGSE